MQEDEGEDEGKRWFWCWPGAWDMDACVPGHGNQTKARNAGASPPIPACPPRPNHRLLRATATCQTIAIRTTYSTLVRHDVGVPTRAQQMAAVGVTLHACRATSRSSPLLWEAC